MTPAIGKTRFRLEPVQSRSLGFVATVQCVNCGRWISVALGVIGGVFRIGNQVVGVCCDDCLNPETRARLAQLRVARTSTTVPDNMNEVA